MSILAILPHGLTILGMASPETSHSLLERPPRRVAVVLLSAIGDVVHGMPVVTSLAEAWPEARIDWVIQPGPGALVAPHPDVSDFVPFTRLQGAAALAEVADFRRRVAGRRYDLVLALQVYFKAGLLTGLLEAPVKLGFDRARAADLNGLFVTHRIPARPVQHVQDQYFEFLEQLGVPVVREWRFGFSEAERRAQEAFFEELDRPALAVVLRTTRKEKDWIPERYARVLEAAESELGLRPVLVGSGAAAERAVAAEVERLTGARTVNALRDDLRRLAWILEGSALVLSPDTGPLHMASALGTPVVGLYGATDPRRAGPYREPFRELVVDRFPRKPDEPPSADFRTGGMERITVEQVVEKLGLAAERFLAGGS
jgi:heptosyltransferase I